LGADAHLYLPGIGYLNGVDAGNYADATATLASVDGPVGRVVDPFGGITANNTTTAQKPILRLDASGRYTWQFDGTDDRLTLASMPIQMADDFVMLSVFSATSATSASGRVLAAAGHSVDSLALARLSVLNTGLLEMLWRDSGGVVQRVTSSASVVAGTTYVTCGRKSGANKTLRVNSVLQGTNTGSLASTTFNNYLLGSRSYGGEFFDGKMASHVICRGNLSDTELVTLERAFAACAGLVI